ncbi:MAG: peptidase M15 [Bacteroidaceae bacterium]|nr:peptidase M15 [Bacteroidales bacterium]MBP3671922.1 peptidase M15 [Bacteroidaceae bacterium]MBQ2979189.1 peptidase M15 [Bacteroidaceae bacterium]
MKYFVLAELTDSAVARRLHIDNTPTPQVTENLIALVENILDPARELMGCPVRVNSGYRCELLNRCVGGVPDSQHLQGQAADVTTTSLSENKRLFEVLLSLPFDQLIWERGNEHGPAWIHVSFCKDGDNRKEVLRL